MAYLFRGGNEGDVLAFAITREPVVHRVSRLLTGQTAFPAAPSTSLIILGDVSRDVSRDVTHEISQGRFLLLSGQ